MGLGNPGEAYRRNRHNLGFMVVDEMARRRRLAFRQPEASYALARQETESGLLHLLKPLTYMNRSGAALLRWAEASGLPVTGEGAVDLLVVCDDLALPLGSLRLRAHGQDGGQKGLASILTALGTREVARLRLGIAGGAGEVPAELWADYVLQDFAPEETEAAEDLVSYACDALEFWLARGLAQTVARFNRRIQAADDSLDPDPQTDGTGDPEV